MEHSYVTDSILLCWSSCWSQYIVSTNKTSLKTPKSANRETRPVYSCPVTLVLIPSHFCRLYCCQQSSMELSRRQGIILAMPYGTVTLSVNIPSALSVFQLGLQPDDASEYSNYPKSRDEPPSSSYTPPWPPGSIVSSVYFILLRYGATKALQITMSIDEP